MPLSGVLCDLDFLDGWPLAFYVFGALGVLWYIPWHFCVFDTPAQHPRIDPRERSYIESALGKAPCKEANNNNNNNNNQQKRKSSAVEVNQGW
ncbi:hypothetical protein FOCC_FOCC016836 [Frankliniella occidentalis]|nr:hypothetical protein FOCC_FOCC016836 [Frankliniella occidentalis]